MDTFSYCYAAVSLIVMFAFFHEELLSLSIVDGVKTFDRDTYVLCYCAQLIPIN